MNSKQALAALKYNRRKNYPAPFWKRICHGVAARGSYLTEAVSHAVAAWQATHSLKPDGMVGGLTLAALGLAGTTRAKRGLVPRGLWFDQTPPKNSKQAKAYARKINALGFCKVSVMLSSSKRKDKHDVRIKTPVFKWTVEQVKRFRAALDAHEIDLGLTVWPRPWGQFSQSLLMQLGPYVEAANAKFIELDCEGNWKVNDVKGFASLSDAGAFYVDSLRKLFPELEIGMTTHVDHAEWRGNPTVAHLADYTVNQAYSIYRAHKPKYRWGERYAPGIMQNMAYARSSRVPGVRVELALAAWAQKYPGRKVREAMGVALDVAESHDVACIWYWSSKWILRDWKILNAAREFIRGLYSARKNVR